MRAPLRSRAIHYESSQDAPDHKCLLNPAVSPDELSEGGYSTPSDFVRSLLRERREQKLRQGIDANLLSSLETPAQEVTPEFLASLRRDVRAIIDRKEASGRKSHKEV
jgi:hypothetical protein